MIFKEINSMRDVGAICHYSDYLTPFSCGGALHAPQLAARVRRRRLTGWFLQVPFTIYLIEVC